LSYSDGFVAGWNAYSWHRGKISGLSAEEQRFFIEEWGAPPTNLVAAAAAEGFLKKSPKPKRKPSAYNKAYSRAFAKVQGRYKKKSGGWMKDGYKRAVAAAHKLARK
jgi:hypothetical protein